MPITGHRGARVEKGGGEGGGVNVMGAYFARWTVGSDETF